jgi:D-alanyl-lipoteichoic acid acyltransferase DltB (MBOAT superfamily)
MLFNSIDFAIFLPIVLIVFWNLEKRSFRLGNGWLLASSIFFYGWWDWRYLGLVFLSGGLDYWASIRIEGSPSSFHRRMWLGVSVALNLGVLGFFKYYDFFVRSFVDAFTILGAPIEASTLGFILPVGISFYTFQSLSYTIDVYRGDLRASKVPTEFGAYLLFFPQLVAGPIERATNLLPQFRSPRQFDLNAAIDGSRQILWGLFKKVVIADQCAPIVNEIFSDPTVSSGNTLVIGAVLFAFQIYGDFSGYSDIAIGCAKLFGITLMRNFAYPYFSRDIAEFWRRWHISLSTWFRDYLYIPLGGSRGTTASRIRNTFIIFLVSGFWHGANYTFIAWGAIHALLFLPLLLRKRNRRHTDSPAEGRWFPSLRETIAISLTFATTTFAWVFFRAADLQSAWDFIAQMASDYLIYPGQLFAFPAKLLRVTPAIFIVIMVLAEWIQRTKQHALDGIEARLSKPLRWAAYYALALMVIYHAGDEQTFIYFQF